jgi:hypothetical protein
MFEFEVVCACVCIYIYADPCGERYCCAVALLSKHVAIPPKTNKNKC